MANLIEDELHKLAAERFKKFYYRSKTAEFSLKSIPWRSIATHGLAATIPATAVGLYSAKKYRDLKQKAIDALIEDEKADRVNLYNAYRAGFLRGRSMVGGGGNGR